MALCFPYDQGDHLLPDLHASLGSRKDGDTCYPETVVDDHLVSNPATVLLKLDNPVALKVFATAIHSNKHSVNYEPVDLSGYLSIINL